MCVNTHILRNMHTCIHLCTYIKSHTHMHTYICIRQTSDATEDMPLVAVTALARMRADVGRHVHKMFEELAGTNNSAYTQRHIHRSFV